MNFPSTRGKSQQFVINSEQTTGDFTWVIGEKGVGGGGKTLPEQADNIYKQFYIGLKQTAKPKEMVFRQTKRLKRYFGTIFTAPNTKLARIRRVKN